jgi:hypothetical protein
MDSIRAVLSMKSVTNAIVMFFAGYGVSALTHLPGRWGVMVGMGAIIANQLGLHQAKPEV